MKKLHLFVFGWLSKLWSLFGSLLYYGTYYLGSPKRDHNFDIHPFIAFCKHTLRVHQAMWGERRDPRGDAVARPHVISCYS